MTKISDAVDVGGIRAKMTVDLSGYNSGIEKAKAKTAELGVAGKKAAAEIGAISDAKTKIAQLTPVLDNINAKIEQQQKKLAGLKLSYDAAFDGDRKNKLQEQINSTEAAILKLTKASDDTAKSIWDLEDGADAAAAQLKKLGSTDTDIAKVSKELEKSGASAGNVSKEIKTLGIAYTALAASMAVVIKKAVESSATFEQSMANVKAISQATGDEFDKLRKQALALGSTTIFTASQTADAQALLAQAGMKTNEILAAMPGLLAGAAAGQVDLATTADIVASSLNGFQLSAEETNRVVDVLAKSSIDTNADITDLGQALKYIAPVASAMGVSIEEAVAAIGELSNAGIKGEMAGTQMRATFLALASPSAEAARYMDLLGVSLSDAAGNIRPLGDLVGQLQGAFTRLTQAQQADVAATLVGREAASGFLTLISQGRTTLDGYTTSLQNAGGTAQQVADTQIDTLNGSITQMKSALEGVGITVGDMFAPAIRTVAETITKALVGFNEMNPALKAAIVAFPVAAAGVLGLVTAVMALSAAFTALNISFPILGAISLAIGAVVAGISAIASWSSAASDSVKKHDAAQKSLNDTLNASPLKRTVSELEELQAKTEELNKKLEERAILEARVNEIAAMDEHALAGNTDMLGELQESNEKLMLMDKLLREMGYEGVEDATAKLAEMRGEIERSTPALFEMHKAEINDLAAKKQTIDSVDKLVAKYKELNAKQELDVSQKQELISTVNALRKEYPDLNAQMDEEGRLRVDNLGFVEQQIDADKAFMTQAVDTQKAYVQNLITTTEQQRKSVEAQIKNYTSLLAVMQSLNGAKISEGNGPVKGGVSDALKVANPQLAKYTEKYASDKYNEKKAELSGLYAEQNALREAESDMKKALNGLTSGDFGASTAGGIDLTKPEKAAKAKAGKSAAELASDARKKAYDADVATLRYQADMYDWAADKQVAAYEKIRTKHKKHLAETVEDERTLNLQIKRLNEDSIKSRFDFSAEWITQEERRMEESGKSETEIAQMKLDAWTRVRDRYTKDSTQYKQADEEVYKARKDLTTKTVKLTEDLVKTQKSSVEDAKKAELAAIEARKKAALADYDARIKAIDALIAKEAEYNSDVDHETAIREKNARIDELASAVSQEGKDEREQTIKDRDRMILEHERELRKRELESQKTALQDEKNAQSDAYDKEKSAAEAQFDALKNAFDSYSGDIKTIEAILAEFRVSESGKANADILSQLDAFVREYNTKMAQITTLNGNNDLSEYNANKDAWTAAKQRGDTDEMKRLAGRNQELRDYYGIKEDSGQKLQSFHGGGVIQGARGAETVVLAKAGELVLTDAQQSALFDVLSGRSAVTPQASGAVTQIVNNIDMGVGAVELTDKADIVALYDERARTVERLQTQGVKTR